MSRCACGAQYTTEQWGGLRCVGVMSDGADGYLELRDCAGCGSTISMPVAALASLRAAEQQRVGAPVADDRCDVTRDGHRCSGRRNHEGEHEAESREYATRASAIESRVAALAARVEALEAAVRRTGTGG